MQKAKSKEQRSKIQEGFTLVEVLVSLAVFSVVMIITTSILLTIVRSTNKARITNRLRNNASRVMEILERDIRAADEVLSTTGVQNLDLRINDDDYYQYSVVAGTPDYIQRLICDDAAFSVNCETAILTPADSNTGLNVHNDTAFAVDGDEVEVTLVFEQPEPIADKPEYNAIVRMESTIVVRNY